MTTETTLPPDTTAALKFLEELKVRSDISKAWQGLFLVGQPVEQGAFTVLT
jgi:hypothetical protein